MVRILITGGNGFIAAHIIELLMARNYDVVVTVRCETSGQKIIEKYPGKNLQFFIVEDMTPSGAMDKVFSSHNDLDYVLHTASPFTQSWTNAVGEVLNPAILGTLETMRSIQAFCPNVKRVVILSSIVALMEGGHDEIDETVWNPVTREEAISNPRLTYIGSKTLAEKAAWDFLEEEKPDFDIVTLNPPLVFGPVAHHLTSLERLNTSNQRVLAFVQGKFRDGALPPTGFYNWVDVRDVALAHLRALDVVQAGGERFILLGGYFSLKMLADTIRATHPELETKLPIDPVDDMSSNTFHFTSKKSLEILGMEYRAFEECIGDTVASLQKAGA